ncbi:YqhR family membrane protein [Thalassobacillus hwangdonensis]|uniref:YqhR family membrane protein n=1 Tax=Thalassobacillus hwangdonensis TaxID=546108 RepID=A0ABW3KYS6_9BACI
MSNEQLEQNQQEKPVSILNKALMTGFVAGVLWGVIGGIAYYFSFTQVSAASFLIRSFFQNSWSGGLLAEVLAILGVGLISILVALIYYLTMKRMNGLVPAILFGIAIWGIVFYLLNPIFPAVPGLGELNSDTIVTTICLFLLYGTFIGYSISYEYHDFNQPAESQAQKQ